MKSSNLVAICIVSFFLFLVFPSNHVVTAAGGVRGEAKFREWNRLLQPADSMLRKKMKSKGDQMVSIMEQPVVSAAVPDPQETNLIPDIPAVVPPSTSGPATQVPHTDSTTGPGNANLTGNATMIVLCRRDARGYPIVESDPRFDQGVPVLAESSLEQADTAITNALETANFASGILSNGRSFFKEASKFAGFLNTVSPLLSLYSFWLGQSETDATQALITSKFSQLDRRLEQLSAQVERGFNRLSRQIADASFDDLLGRLESIRAAQVAFVSASNTTNMTNGNPSYYARSYYEKIFQDACSEPHFLPEDIFRRLYGYACKDCTFGPRNRNFALDVFNESITLQQRTDAFEGFGSAILNGMAQSMYLYSVCHSGATCLDKSKDVIFNGTMSRMKDAFDEIAEVLNETSTICPCKQIALESVSGTGDDENVRLYVGPHDNLVWPYDGHTNPRVYSQDSMFAPKIVRHYPPEPLELRITGEIDGDVKFQTFPPTRWTNLRCGEEVLNLRIDDGGYDFTLKVSSDVCPSKSQTQCDCGETEYCDYSRNGACHPRKIEGEECFSDDECAGGLKCYLRGDRPSENPRSTCRPCGGPNCGCPCKRVTLQRLFTDNDGAGSGVEDVTVMIGEQDVLDSVDFPEASWVDTSGMTMPRTGLTRGDLKLYVSEEDGSGGDDQFARTLSADEWHYPYCDASGRRLSMTVGDNGFLNNRHQTNDIDFIFDILVEDDECVTA